MSDNYLDLPIGWAIASFYDISDSSKNAIVDGPFGSNLKVSDYINDPINGVPVLTTKNLQYGYSNELVRFISKEKYNELKRSEVKGGDILVAKIGSVGKSGLYPKDSPIAIIPANLLKMTVSTKIDKKYVLYFLESKDFLKKLKTITTATAQPAFNLTKFKLLKIALPPAAEQNRIVSKLEELFTKLDVSIAELKKAKAQIKRYRQSVLKHAFEGKLTEQWRVRSDEYRKETAEELLAKIKEERKKALGKKYKELPPVDTTNLPKLPDGWVWVSLAQITSILGDGLHGTPKYSLDGEYYFINGNNLVDGKIEIKSDTKRIAQDEYVKYRKELNDNSILVSINGTLGKTAFYNNEKVILGKSACYFNVIQGIEKKYVRFILVSQRFLDYASKTATGSTIQNVPLSAMREFPIPIPYYIEEQLLVISEIEHHFSVADETEKLIDQSLKQAERLRQSILKDAFTGKLVPQDPNEEPASVLLERIKEEREKLNKEVKPKKRKGEPAEKPQEKTKKSIISGKRK